MVQGRELPPVQKKNRRHAPMLKYPSEGMQEKMPAQRRRGIGVTPEKDADMTSPVKSPRARAQSTVSSFVTLGALISGENHAQTAGFFGDGIGSAVTWIYCAFVLCLITAGLVFVFRRNKRRNRTHRHRRRTHTHAPVPAPVIKNKGPVNSPFSTLSLAAGFKNGANGFSYPKPMSKSDSHGAKPFHRHRRKRIFDYPKFYTKVVRELSRRHYGPPIGTNEKSKLNGHASNHGHA